MTIWFVNRYFHPDHSATSQMLGDLAFALAAAGEDVRVVTSRQRYDEPAARLPPLERIDGVTVHRVPTSRFGRRSLAGRALDYLTFYLACCACLLRRVRHGDIVVAKTDPPLISVVAALAARVRGARLVNWLQDLFPEVAVALGVRGARSASGPLLRLRDWSLRTAVANVAIGERMRERLRARGVPDGTLAVIHNWAHADRVHPVPPAVNALRARWRLGERFVVGYSGNLGRAHDEATIAAAVRLLAQAGNDRIAFVFIGGGSGLDRLRADLAGCSPNMVQFHPYQPRERLAESLSVPDLHLVSLRPALEGLIVPSKLYGSMAAGRATLNLGDPDGEVGRVLRTLGAGISVAPGDPQALVRALLDCAAAPAAMAATGATARAALVANFDFETALAQWRTLLARVRGGSAAGSFTPACAPPRSCSSTATATSRHHGSP